jgi:hypothetical protein
VGDALAGGVFGAEEVILRIDHVVFGPGNAAQDGARGELLGVKAHALHDLLDEAGLIVLIEDGEGAGEALVTDFQGFDVAAEDAHAKGVESGDQGLGERGVAEQLFDTLGHFAGGLVREGDGEDGVGRDVLLLDEPGDAVGNDACFAGASAGEDEQWALRGLDGSALFGIEMGEKGVQGVDSGEKVPESSVSFGRRAVSEAKFGRRRD